MKSIRNIIVIVMMFCYYSSKADSPITSTSFADVYNSERIVRNALMAKGKITHEIMVYLSEETNPVEVKIATINALSWGNDNYESFISYLKNKYSTQSEITLLANLDASTLISLAYIKAMSNYFDVKEAFIIAQNAALKQPQSLSINMINALIYAQMAMDYNYCTVFQVCDRVVKDETLIKDLHPKAIEQIMEYINLYSDGCAN